MSKFARIVVLVTALASLFAVMSSTAGAVTFTNSGSTAFTATGGPGTLSIGANDLACPSSSATGAVPSGAFTAVTGTITSDGCSLIGIHTSMTCNYALTPVSFSPGQTTGTVDMSCVYRLGTSPFTALCNINGPTPGAYTNPASPTKGRITLSASTTLVVTNATDSSCSLLGVPTGTSRNVALTEQTITVTNGTPTTLGPVITSP